MSVLNQSGEEQVECPLCMEPLEVDDLNFFPCTCGYQICRFCWHRIRTDENGLCPACRKAYSEDPADFIPLSKEQVAQLKAEKRQRDQQRKAKLSESRKHLASVRVVQRNLVFVVGLPMRLADPEVLKKYEYFGKFGKIHKVVINQSTSYAGTQGPSASAYVTYMKSDDALRAIQNVNNTIMDGKTIKTSLGTTKYCSHFMKNQPCPKPDCMYLHDFGDQEASFTKEQMHAGKHQEYEKKLHDVLLSRLAAQAGTNGQQNNTNNNNNNNNSDSQKPPGKQKEQQSAQQKTEPSATVMQTSSSQQQSSQQTQGTNKENWPHLNNEKGADQAKKEKEKAEKDKKGKKSGKGERKKEGKKSPPPSGLTNCPVVSSAVDVKTERKEDSPDIEESTRPSVPVSRADEAAPTEVPVPKLPVLDDNSSFFSQMSFTKIANDGVETDDDPCLLAGHEPLLEMNDTDSWDFNFGTKHSSHLEELAKLRTDVKDTLLTMGDYDVGPVGGYFGPVSTHNTENLLETLAKNSVNYVQRMQAPNGTRPYAPKDLNGINTFDVSKMISDLKGFNHHHQEPPQQPPQHPMLDYENGGFSPLLGYGVNGLSQSQPPQTNGFYGPAGAQPYTAKQHSLAVFQQRQIEEQLKSMTLGGGAGGGGTFQHPQQPQQHPMLGQMNGGTAFGGSAISSAKSRPIPEEKELDFRFQETKKALEELVESDSHMHNSGRTNIGTSQINGLVNSQCGSYVTPPPPGFVPHNTHMNSFGSKILPYLNMNSQQQQMNTSQNSWPSSFSQNHQQQQHKDPAILSSRRHIPNMPPILDPYSPLAQLGAQQPSGGQQLQNGGGTGPQQQQPQSQRSYEAFNGGFASFTAATAPAAIQQTYGNYSHLAQQNLNWLGNEINTQISSPPGFRTSGQATKQQEC